MISLPLAIGLIVIGSAAIADGYDLLGFVAYLAAMWLFMHLFEGE